MECPDSAKANPLLEISKSVRGTTFIVSGYSAPKGETATSIMQRVILREASIQKTK